MLVEVESRPIPLVDASTRSIPTAATSKRTYSHLMPTVNEDLDFLSESRPDQTGPNGPPNAKRPRRKWAEAFGF